MELLENTTGLRVRYANVHRIFYGLNEEWGSKVGMPTSTKLDLYTQNFFAVKMKNYWIR